MGFQDEQSCENPAHGGGWQCRLPAWKWCWAAVGAPMILGRHYLSCFLPTFLGANPRLQSWSPWLAQLRGSHIYSP